MVCQPHDLKQVPLEGILIVTRWVDPSLVALPPQSLHGVRTRLCFGIIEGLTVVHRVVGVIPISNPLNTLVGSPTVADDGSTWMDPFLDDGE